MNKPASTHEEFRVFDLFSPNETSDQAAARRTAESARVRSKHTHINPASARDSFVFANPLFAPARPDTKR